MIRKLTPAILVGVLAICPDSGNATGNRVKPQPEPAVAAAAAIQLVPVITTGLASPLYIGNAHDGTDRLFIVEQGGIIKVLQPGSSTPTVFLDITTKVLSGGEQGLLGLAFHPQFSSNRRFFVNYTRKPDGATVIAEYQASAINPDIAGAAEIVLLTIPQPFANHNGGMIEFGPDGFLYIGMGDGGAGSDPGNRAQNINDLLGKMLRINVDVANGSIPYSSPPDNPFFGSTPGLDEIFALGLRNPFRFSFDRLTGSLFLGDVGQGQIEEIDIITNGGNYGWRVFEGTQCTGLDPALCMSGSFIPPITQYSHAAGRCSVTGGYVYRGTRSSLPLGSYVFADFCTGEIFLLDNGSQSVLLDTSLLIASFGEDEDGEIYVVGLGGQVHRIAAAAPGPACGFSLSPAGQSFAVTGGTGSISVSAPAGCTWSAASNAPWILITSGSAGSGSGAVTFSVASNKGGIGPRSATISAAGQTFAVVQAGPAGTCAFSISPPSQSFTPAGGTGSFGVTTTAGCSWIPVSNASWITITSGGNKGGSGVVNYSVAASPGANRQGTVSVPGAFFVVTQTGSGCAFSLMPSSASFTSAGGPGSVEVTAGAGCAWMAASNAPWITITGGSSGTGNGAVNYTVAANAITSPRTGTMTIAGQTFTVNQAAAPCTFSIDPGNASFGSGVGSGSTSVSAPAGCAWTAISNDSWIVITSGSSGSGNGTVNYSVSANPNTTTRIGTMTIGGETFTVNQAAAPPTCTFSIMPSSASFGSSGGSGSTSVVAPSGCAWTAVSNDSWISITAGSTGSGNGTVNYSVAANPTTNTRTGTMTIASQTFTVTQAAATGGCGFSILPIEAAFSKKGGAGSVNVTANTGCTWTAVSNASWITITSGSKGSGQGQVAYLVAANSTGQTRSATITLAGLTFTVRQSK